jgi:signal transduction histidine kinase
MSEAKQPIFPPSSNPKDVLKVLIDEIEKPVVAIQGIAELLNLQSLESTSETEEYLRRIQSLSQYIRQLLKDGRDYLENQ